MPLKHRFPGDIHPIDLRPEARAIPDYANVPAHILERLARLHANRGEIARARQLNATYDAARRKHYDDLTKRIEMRYLEGELARLRGINHARIHFRLRRLKKDLGE